MEVSLYFKGHSIMFISVIWCLAQGYFGIQKKRRGTLVNTRPYFFPIVYEFSIGQFVMPILVQLFVLIKRIYTIDVHSLLHWFYQYCSTKGVWMDSLTQDGRIRIALLPLKNQNTKDWECLVKQDVRPSHFPALFSKMRALSFSSHVLCKAHPWTIKWNFGMYVS